jgi:UPF0716 protein FxsA
MSPLRLAPLLIFVAFPLVELALLIKAGETLGFWPTIGILVASTALGILVIRQQGLSMIGRMISAMNEGRLPLEPLVDGYARIMAGLLLIVPGLLSDAMGLFLLIAPLRRLALRWVFAGLVGRTGPHPSASSPKVARPTVIEGTYERVDEQDVKPDKRH